MHDSGGEIPRLFQYKICIPERPCHRQNRQPPEKGKLKIKFGRVGRL